MGPQHWIRGWMVQHEWCSTFPRTWRMDWFHGVAGACGAPKYEVWWLHVYCTSKLVHQRVDGFMSTVGAGKPRIDGSGAATWQVNVVLRVPICTWSQSLDGSTCTVLWSWCTEGGWLLSQVGSQGHPLQIYRRPPTVLSALHSWTGKLKGGGGWLAKINPGANPKIYIMELYHTLLNI
jgi:hypothetical protein